MSERDASADGLCSDAAPDSIPPPRASRGRRSGVVLPAGGQDSDTFLLESVKAAPRRSSIIKVKVLPKCLNYCFQLCCVGIKTDFSAQNFPRNQPDLWPHI